MVLVETAGLTKVFGDVRAVDDLTVKIPDGAIGLVDRTGPGRRRSCGSCSVCCSPRPGPRRSSDATSGTACPCGSGSDNAGARLPRPDMTGVGLVSYMGRISGLDRDTAMSRSHDVLQFVGVEEERYRKIAEYSTGMKQKDQARAIDGPRPAAVHLRRAHDRTGPARPDGDARPRADDREVRRAAT